MTDPLALDPVLSPTERSGGAAPARKHDEAYDAWFARFEAHVMNGGKVEAVDPVPTAAYILSALNGHVAWYRPDGRLSARTIADAYADLSLRAVQAGSRS